MNTQGYFNRLNDQQRKAAECCDGPSLIVAGAGSGKTLVLTCKIARLLEMGYNPWNILALTFTNKAAREMKTRIADMVGVEQTRYLWMGTFHSMFLRILRTEHDLLGFSSNFTIYDASDSKSLIKSIIKEMHLDDKVYKASVAQDRISDAKNRLISFDMYANSQDCYNVDAADNMPAIRDIYTAYWNRCRQAEAMDFDDILLYTFNMFDRRPDILQKYVDNFHYVLVDEYQDTNYAQHQIVLQLTRERRNVCVVGDDAQSIYSFRGAVIDNILQFQNVYPGTQLFKLEQNYRSTKTIVNAANSLIHKNTYQIHKNVFSEKEEGDRLQLIEACSDIEEAQIIVDEILKLRRNEGYGYDDYAILYRTNAQSRQLEEQLRKHGLPYRIYGGLSFYQRKEIKDVIAYFRLAVNPHDEEALKRVINYPARGIGNTSLMKIVECATQHAVSLWTVITSPEEYQLSLNKGMLAKVAEFTSLIQRFIDKAQTDTADIAGRYIIENCGIIADIYQDKDPENLSRQENVEELVNGLQDFCDGRKEEGDENVTLSDYLSEVSLLSDVDSDGDDEGEKVTLMTIHSAKGLEFSNIFVTGLEENLLPNQMCSGTIAGLEEERRLFYVAITRAKKHCIVTFAKSRMRYGKMEFSTPSRFLKDIDSRYVDFRGSMRRSFGSREVEIPWRRSSSSGSFGRPSDDGQSRYSGGQTRVVSTSTNWGPNHTAKIVPLSTPPSQPSNLRRVSTIPTSALRKSGTVSELKAGQHVEHERFGVGTVMKVEGSGENLKATVQFEHSGVRQLLLKFARLTILD